MKHRYIYLVFSKTGTWLWKTINIVTNVKYVHSSISFDESFTEMYSFGRTNPNNPFSGGLVKESFNEGVYKRFTQSECMIYKVNVTEDQYQAIRTGLEAFLQAKDNYKYNFLGLFGVLLNISVKRKNYYFCSQFVSELLIKGNVFNFSKEPELISTTDLLELDNMELVYEGYINKYTWKNKNIIGENVFSLEPEIISVI